MGSPIDERNVVYIGEGGIALVTAVTILAAVIAGWISLREGDGVLGAALRATFTAVFGYFIALRGYCFLTNLMGSSLPRIFLVTLLVMLFLQVLAML